jgi:predicted MPP superfamily phosphohydrolase
MPVIFNEYFCILQLLMILLLILVVTEVLTLVAIRQHLYDRSWMRYYLFVVINFLISLWVWILWLKVIMYEGIYDEPDHIWLLMSFNGAICAVIIPKIILIVMHFPGVIARRHYGGHNRILTNTALIISPLIFLTILTGTLYGRFNFKTDYFTVKIQGLNPELKGLKIVQISDLHLSSFHHQRKMLLKVMKEINKEDPDILINTGDFITIGWREFEGFDTILSVAESRYGNFAILGNHDAGTYNPFFTEADKENNILLLNRMITSSGYRVLNDESVLVSKGNAKISFSGVTTEGHFPKIISGDVKKATKGTDSADLKILLTHDPNHWAGAVKGKTDINITFSGHTHGMQIGIITKMIAWSPAKYFYPRWNGLYSEGNQFLVVNRGLGVLGLPFRIWMPPEISVVTLEAG